MDVHYIVVLPKFDTIMVNLPKANEYVSFVAATKELQFAFMECNRGGGSGSGSGSGGGCDVGNGGDSKDCNGNDGHDDDDDGIEKAINNRNGGGPESYTYCIKIVPFTNKTFRDVSTSFDENLAFRTLLRYRTIYIEVNSCLELDALRVNLENLKRRVVQQFTLATGEIGVVPLKIRKKRKLRTKIAKRN